MNAAQSTDTGSSAAAVAAAVCTVSTVYAVLGAFSAGWLFHVSRRARPGWRRLLSASPPLLGTLLVVPCCFSREGPEGIMCAALSMLAGVTALKVRTPRGKCVSRCGSEAGGADERGAPGCT